MTSNVLRARQGCNCACSLINAGSFPQQDRTCHSLAVRHIRQRTLCSISTAALFASLAGYPTEVI